MTTRVVVLGAGYAGATAVKRLQSKLNSDAELVWVDEHDYHFVLHESHRVVRDRSIADRISIPVDAIAADDTTFVEGRVANVDVEDREVVLADDRAVGYDFLVVALGSGTAFYGIPGIEERAHTLKSRLDAEGIHEAVVEAAREGTRQDRAQVVVGGAGLSGIQTAGEVARFRDERNAPVEVRLVEALDEILPGSDDSLQSALRSLLEDADVDVTTGDPITEVTADQVHHDEGEPLDYDVFVWTGGIAGGDALERVGVDRNEHSDRLLADATFETSDRRVFAVGDAAVIELDGSTAPPTAQAAWDAGEAAADNVVRRIEGRELREWTYTDKGTLVSVGEDAIAHDVIGIPVTTFGRLPARTLKKIVAARWIADVSSRRRALRAWGDL